ncbi:MAG: sigma 54-interacting transcriptional regulator [Balneolaceae bacterium]
MKLSAKKKPEPEKTSLEDIEKSSKSALMRDIINKILGLAKLDSNVVIIGEIGSGKKRLARIIHQNSYRSNGPFHSFYCVDVNEDEYKEAFLEHLQFEENHIVLKYDAIEKARQGILYLDQFSELSPYFMLNIIHSFVHCSKQHFKYDKTNRPRLILSMNQESYQNIYNTSTWKSVLQLINPIGIMLPPLRERKEDIPMYIDFFLKEIKDKYQEWNDLKISSQAFSECSNYNWPGNLMQLKNAILQGAILSYGKTIESRHLPFSMSWKLPYDFEDNKLLY